MCLKISLIVLNAFHFKRTIEETITLTLKANQ